MWQEWAYSRLVLVDDVDCGRNADGEIQGGVYNGGETTGNPFGQKGLGLLFIRLRVYCSHDAFSKRLKLPSHSWMDCNLSFSSPLIGILFLVLGFTPLWLSVLICLLACMKMLSCVNKQGLFVSKVRYAVPILGLISVAWWHGSLRYHAVPCRARIDTVETAREGQTEEDRERERERGRWRRIERGKEREGESSSLSLLSFSPSLTGFLN